MKYSSGWKNYATRQELKEARKAMDETAKAALAEARAIGLKQGRQRGEELG